MTVFDSPTLRRLDREWLAQYSRDPGVASAAKALWDVRNRAFRDGQRELTRDEKRTERRYLGILDRLANQSGD